MAFRNSTAIGLTWGQPEHNGHKDAVKVFLPHNIKMTDVDRYWTINRWIRYNLDLDLNWILCSLPPGDLLGICSGVVFQSWQWLLEIRSSRFKLSSLDLKILGYGVYSQVVNSMHVLFLLINISLINICWGISKIPKLSKHLGNLIWIFWKRFGDWGFPTNFCILLKLFDTFRKQSKCMKRKMCSK